MKKTSFLKGLAMAAVAMVCAFTTSCSEEELKINGSDIQLPAASASLTVSVVDLERSEVLSVKTTDVTSAMGSDYTVECPAIDGYTTANAVTVNIPKVAAGQAVNIPVTFYVVKLSSAYAEILKTLKVVDGTKKFIEPEEVVADNDAEDFINKTAYDKEVTAKFTYKSGTEYYVAAESKAANTIAGILGEMMKFKTKTAKLDWTIAPWCQAAVKASQKFYTQKAKATYQGEEQEFLLVTASDLLVEVAFSVIPGYEHDYTHNNHGHGHGHGDNGNAGGGIIIAE